MTFQPIFVPGGVYLRTLSGELVGRLDKPGLPFRTLSEARDHADWLEMVVQFQRAQREAELAGGDQAIAPGIPDTQTHFAFGREKQLVPHDIQDGKVNHE